MTSLARRAPPVDHAVVVELVGAAAAGKSTLVAELRRRDPQIRWLQRARGDGGAIALAREALRFAPAWFAAVPRAPRHTLRHTRYYLRLATLDGVVRRALNESSSVVMLEHGPIFTLARLRASHHGPLPASLARYAARLLARWAGMLNLVVALDAPVGVLQARISSRAKAHVMRDASAEEFTEFVERYRAAYDAVLAELHAAGGPPVLTLRTDQESVTVLADRVAAALEEARRAR